MRLYRFLLARSRRTLALALVASLINGASTTALIYWINQIIAPEIIAPQPGHALQGSTPVYIALLSLVFSSGVLAQVLLVRLTSKAVCDLQLALVQRILAMPLPRIEALGVNRLYAMLTQDIGAVANTLTALPMLSFHVAIMLGGFIYLGWLSWRWLLTVLAVLAFAVLIYQWLAGKARGLMSAHRREQDALYAHYDALLLGTKALKLRSARRAHFLQAALQPTAESLKDLYRHAHSAWAYGVNWANLIALLLVGGLVLLYQRHPGTTTAQLTAYVVTLLFLRAHIGGVLNLLPALTRGNIALQNIDALGLAQASDASGELVGLVPAPNGWRSLAVDGVCFEYPAEENGHAFRVGPLNIRFEPGEIVFLTGGNGSGKSTFAKLITGLYRPSKGEFRLDDQPIDDHNRAWYQQHFSAVFSDFFLFHDLLSQHPERLRTEAGAYLARLELDHKVSVKDGRLSSTDLSNGQRKRLALLAAYLEVSPIYLFDEWAADQDPQFKQVFYRELLPELKQRGKTVLVISHDDRYFDAADRVLKFKEGKIILNGEQ